MSCSDEKKTDDSFLFFFTCSFFFLKTAQHDGNPPISLFHNRPFDTLQQERPRVINNIYNDYNEMNRAIVSYTRGGLYGPNRLSWYVISYHGNFIYHNTIMVQITIWYRFCSHWIVFFVNLELPYKQKQLAHMRRHSRTNRKLQFFQMRTITSREAFFLLWIYNFTLLLHVFFP